VIISMIIIVVVFGIAMMIFTNVTRFTISAKQIRAKAALQDLLVKEEQSKAIASQSITVGDFTVEEAVTAYNNQDNLILVQLTAFDQNRQQVAVLQKVLLKPE
jgi:hypothetical protein